MTSRGTKGINYNDLDEELIAEYLRAHPELLERDTELLEVLKIPHETGASASLIEKQVEVLRAKNRQLERQLKDLVQVARDNEGLSSRLHRLTLDLMEADSVDAVIAASKDLLRNEFPDTHVVLGVFDHTPASSSETLDTNRDAYAALFDQQGPVCGELDEPRRQAVFGEHADEVASAVLVPLQDAYRLGILALGSPDARRFRAGMGTLFPQYLGELISRALKIRV